MLKSVARICVVVCAATFGFAPGTRARADTVQCASSQTTRVFGGTQWTVAVCGRKILAVVPAPGNPGKATFVILPNAKVLRMDGTKPGDSASDDAAEQDMTKLSPADIAALMAELKGN